MKVLFTFGGMPHYLNAMLERMQSQGVDVTVVMPAKGNGTIGEGVKMVDEHKFTTITTPERKMWWGKLALPALPEIVAEQRPDIVVLGWPYFLQIRFQSTLRKAMKNVGAKLMIREIPFQTPPYGGIREYFKNEPLIDENMRVLSHGTSFWVRQMFIAKVRRYCYAKAAGMLAYCSLAHDIIPSYGLPDDRIFVTYNSTDTDALMAVREKVLASEPLMVPSTQRFLHIGRLVKWKRVDLLIDAFAKLVPDYHNAELVIVGKGPELENLKQQAAPLGDKVKFVGAIYAPEELGAYMHESSVYVLAGMGGLSINDAMTYGMPVICSRCDGTERDLVTDGENGYIFREGDADDLAYKMRQFLADSNLAGQMGEKSQKVIREKINISTVCERYIGAFNAVLKG